MCDLIKVHGKTAHEDDTPIDLRLPRHQEFY